MPIPKEEILEAVNTMSVLEISDFIAALEAKYGVTAAKTQSAQSAPLTDAPSEIVTSTENNEKDSVP